MTDEPNDDVNDPTDGDGQQERDPAPKLERVQKVLAAAGIASRRASEDLIHAGRVTIDGRVATLGDKVDPAVSSIHVDGERVIADQTRHYVMLNKPQGVVTTADDPEGRQTVFDLINVPARLFTVGRLDLDTEGLLLLTNDGELAHALMHPSFQVPRVYVALVPGPARRSAIAQLTEGVELEDGIARAQAVEIVDEGKGKVLLQITMTEGRKREVRRMLAEVGLPVERLARTSYAGVELGDLRQGKWRPLTGKEIGMLFASIEGGPQKKGQKPSKKKSPKPQQKGQQKGGGKPGAPTEGAPTTRSGRSAATRSAGGAGGKKSTPRRGDAPTQRQVDKTRRADGGSGKGSR